MRAATGTRPRYARSGFRMRPTMKTRLLLTAILLPVMAASQPAAAQAPGGFAAPPAQEPPPCVKAFLSLRGDAEKKALAIRSASERKAEPKEVCALFNNFVASEAKVVKYAADNTVWCGIPPEAVKQMAANHERMKVTRARVCQAAAAPPRRTGPTLGEALGTMQVPSASNVKTGRGTYDTLTGTPLGR